MATNKNIYVVYNLRETYHEYGVYEFKIVLSPKHFKNSHMCDMKLTDSDGNEMKYELKKWGRKLNCIFTVDKDVSDGVSSIGLELKDDKDLTHSFRKYFWVIKP